jgi:lipoprotein signal peptidase
MTDRSFRGLFFGLALAGLLLDQASKYLVFQWLHDDQYKVRQGLFQSEISSGLFEFETHEAGDGTYPGVNQGALFGFLRDHELANGLFAAISVVAAAAIVFWALRRSASRDWSLSAALGLILAGTLGNLYDRVVFGGVRDFLHVHYYQRFDWPVFNVADSCLVLGAFLLLTQAVFSRAPADRPALELSQTVEVK